jgi:hypothetical protein
VTSLVEEYIGVTCACLPLLKAFSKRFFPNLFVFDPAFEQRLSSSLGLPFGSGRGATVTANDDGGDPRRGWLGWKGEDKDKDGDGVDGEVKKGSDGEGKEEEDVDVEQGKGVKAGLNGDPNKAPTVATVVEKQS